MMCKHKWKFLSETTTESQLEHAARVMPPHTVKGYPSQVCDADRKHIQVFTCELCGRLKRFVEDI